MSKNDRPLSPHLSIYRWPITMATSILHRATGIAMSAGFLILVVWLFAAASGPDAYNVFAGYMGTIIGRVLLFAWSLAFFYHLSNGIRHLVWDSGRGFEKSTASASAWFVLILPVVLTGAFWWRLL